MPRIFAKPLAIAVSLAIFLILMSLWILTNIAEANYAGSPNRSASSEPSFRSEEVKVDDSVHYGVIIDAGSSGSRVFVYYWPSHTGDKRQLLKIRPLLDHRNLPVVKKVSPGLSSLGPTPQNASQYIRPLLDYASLHIPAHKIRETSLFIFATAGLRLIPESQSSAILTNLREEIPKLFDFIVHPSNIDMIPGKWEGIYSWMAVNYALGRFNTDFTDDEENLVEVYNEAENRTTKRRATVGMIDMGGGSVQIAYEIRNKVPRMSEHLTAEINLGFEEPDYQHQYRIYVTTFLGFGANSAQDRYEEMLRQFYQIGSNSHATTTDDSYLTDPCIQPGRVRHIHSADNKSAVLFTAKGSGNFHDCIEAVRTLLNGNKTCVEPPCSFNGVHQPKVDFHFEEFFGFSELWYTSNDVLGLSGKYEEKKFKMSAAEFCSTSWSKIWSRFQQKLYPKADKDRLQTQCFKSAWMYAIMHDGFKLPKSARHFKAVSEINGQEVQWTLGALLYHMRFFPLGDLQRLQRQKSTNVVVNNDFFSRLTSGPISQILLIGCFVAVLVAAARYLHILNRFHRPNSVSSRNSQPTTPPSPMTRNRSMLSYMMLDEKNGRNQPGIKTEWSGYVY